MAKSPERRLQALVLKCLKALRADGHQLWWQKINDSITAGIPDILGCYQGIFFALELKAPGEKATRLQELTLNAIAKANGVVAVVDSIEDFWMFVGEMSGGLMVPKNADSSNRR